MCKNVCKCFTPYALSVSEYSVMFDSEHPRKPKACVFVHGELLYKCSSTMLSGGMFSTLFLLILLGDKNL